MQSFIMSIFCTFTPIYITETKPYLDSYFVDFSLGKRREVPVFHHLFSLSKTGMDGNAKSVRMSIKSDKILLDEYFEVLLILLYNSINNIFKHNWVSVSI